MMKWLRIYWPYLASAGFLFVLLIISAVRASAFGVVIRKPARYGPWSASPAGIELIKSFERLRLSAYQDSGKKWTIGYGHTGTARAGMQITESQALELLRQDVGTAVDTINRLVYIPLTQGQVDALTSFVFNIGQGNFSRSDMLYMLNTGDMAGAASEFDLWVNVNGVRTQGLVNRRARERALFETDSYQNLWPV